jgi:hypothetical protein
MNYRLLDARHNSDFTLWLRFSDGVEGEIDLQAELHGTMFEPLRNTDTFRLFVLHPELHTLVWPNGADFSPEFLHDNVRVTASHK